MVLDKELISWICGGVAAITAAAWKAFTYFDKIRRKEREARRERSSEGIPPEEVVSLFRELLSQVQERAPQNSAAAEVHVGPSPPNVDHMALGKFLALVLRHDPTPAAIELDSHGWSDVNRLLAGINAAGYHATLADFDAVVDGSVGKEKKPRFSFSPDRQRIRANWGHTFREFKGL